MTYRLLFAIVLISLFTIQTLALEYEQQFDYKYTKSGFKYAYHEHNEISYQQAHCSYMGGVEEYELQNKMRVDCLTSEFAIEYDFADKYKESYYQATAYAMYTDRRPMIVLILDKKYAKKQKIYGERLKELGKFHKLDLKVEYITDDILKPDNQGRCNNPTCKCKRKTPATTYSPL